MVSTSRSVRLFIMEEVELYRHIYELAALNGSVDLLDVCEEFNKDKLENTVSTGFPDVLLLGTKRLDRDIVEELIEIRQHHSALGIVLVFSSFAEKDMETLRKLAKAGEGGIGVFLRQSLDQVEQLSRMVVAVSQGQVVLDPMLTRFLFSNDPDSPFLKELTPKEKEILSLLANSYTNSAIARALFVDIKTVEHHLNNIYGKLKASDDFSGKHPRVAITRLYLKETGELVTNQSS